jgi:hypothetical protein
MPDKVSGCRSFRPGPSVLSAHMGPTRYRSNQSQALEPPGCRQLSESHVIRGHATLHPAIRTTLRMNTQACFNTPHNGAP